MYGKPVASKLTLLKEIERNRVIHEERLQKVRGQVDHHKPQAYQVHQTKTKKDFIQDMKSDDIEKGNQFLLEKIKRIMDPAKSQRNQRSITAVNPSVQANSSKSLNKEVRKQQLVKIMNENQLLMSKISHSKPTYSTRQLLDQRKETEKYIAAICDYQYKDLPATKTLVQQQIFNPNASIQDKKSVRAFTPRRLQPIHQQKPNYLFKEFKVVNHDNYQFAGIIENGCFQIIIENLSRYERKCIIEFSEAQGLQILKEECSNNWLELINRIGFDEKQKYFYFKAEKKKSSVGSQNKSLMKKVYDKKVSNVNNSHKITYQFREIIQEVNQDKIDEDDNENQQSQMMMEQNSKLFMNKSLEVSNKMKNSSRMDQQNEVKSQISQQNDEQYIGEEGYEEEIDENQNNDFHDSNLQNPQKISTNWNKLSGSQKKSEQNEDRYSENNDNQEMDEEIE